MASYFLECHSIGIYLAVFPWLHWSYGFREEYYRDKLPFSSHHIRGHSSNITSLLMFTLITTSQIVWDFLQCKITFFSPTLSTLYSLEESHYAQLTLKEKIIRFNSFRAEHLHELEICPHVRHNTFPYMYSFLIYIGMETWIHILYSVL